MNGVERVMAMGALGACGALLRFAVGEAWTRWGTGPSWLSTLLVNVLGCFLFGVVDRLALVGLIGPGLRVALLVGFLGAFTTFSTYAREIVALGGARDFSGLALQFTAQNILGVLAVLAGMAVGEALGR